jgi:hypothetical protein
MMKTKLQHLLIAFFGLALFSCENSENPIEPVDNPQDGLNSSHSSPVIEEAEICGDMMTVPLNYGGGTTGEVTIANDESNLYVSIYSENGFQDTDDNVALWLGTDLGDLELNSFGIPLTESSYDYLDKATGNEYTFTVPLSEVRDYNEETCGENQIYVVTQVAAVVEVDGSTALLNAYGGNNIVDTSFPWWFDAFVPRCCDDVPPPVNDVCGEPLMVPLQYGGGTTGEVTISNDEDSMYVHIYSEDGFQEVEDNVALWLGTDLDDLELNSFGIPLTNSSYDWLATASGTEYTFSVALSDIRDYDEETCGANEVYVVTQVAAVIEENGSTALLNAYGGTNLVDTSFPWWFEPYTPRCCNGEEPPAQDGCESAYAKFPVEGDYGYGYVFASSDDANPDGHFSLELTNNQWGWAGRFVSEGSYEIDLWAAAGLNDTDNATLVGSVTVEISGDNVTVTYNLDDDYLMDELHIYASNMIPETTAPGQFGYTMEFDDPVSTYTSDFTLDGEQDIWIITYANVCGEYSDDEG